MADSDVKATVPQGLQLFYAMYAVALVFGIQEISGALYKSFKVLFGANRDFGHVMINVALFIGIMLLIVRFFWSTGNVRRAWLRSEDRRRRIAPLFIVIHLPILLFQGVLVLFLCFAYSDGASTLTAAQPVIFWFVAATAWNALWLWMLIGLQRHWPEAFWIANNLALVLAGAVILFGLRGRYIGDSTGLAIFAALSIASSGIDLWKTAESYLTDAGY